MPGMAGGIGVDSLARNRLVDYFRTIWDREGTLTFEGVDTCEFISHSFGNYRSAYHSKKDNILLSVDGECSIYRLLADDIQEQGNRLFDIVSGKPVPTSSCKGNIALFDADDGKLHIYSEQSGLFPLYYSVYGDTILFSSHIKPLAKAIEASPDPAGIIQFVKLRFIYGNRSFFSGIKRLLPGQYLVFDSKTGAVQLGEYSKAWANRLENNDISELASMYIEALQNSVKRSSNDIDRLALMSSGGWDSRVLLGAFKDLAIQEKLYSYSHSGRSGLESKIVRRIMKDEDIRCHVEDLNENIFNIDDLNHEFDRVENVVFPHWNRASRFLSSVKGIESVAAGIFGEVGGGHYTPAMMLPRIKRGFVVGAELSNIRKLLKISYSDGLFDLQKAKTYFLRKNLGRPWSVCLEYYNDQTDLAMSFKQDIESNLKRLESRGVSFADQMIEALLTETRGAQYIAAQLRSCRAHLDISSFYSDSNLFELTSWIPADMKIHNKLVREVLRVIAPGLLNYPTVATLTKSRRPMIVQESGRILRRMYDLVAFKLRLKTAGRIRMRLTPWHDYEFLRDGKILMGIVRGFNSGIIDTKACVEYINDVERYRYPYELYNAQNEIMTAFTIERLLDF